LVAADGDHLGVEQYFIFDIASGDHEEVVFLNTEMVSICGYKYEDMDGDGILEAGDTGIAGWTIYLFEGTVEEDEKPIATTVTNCSGGYCFTGLPAGTYTVIEEAREGWYNTTLGEVEVTLGSGGSANINFLNTEYFDLCGYKYEDMNGDSILDDGDVPVEGWLIQLVQDDEVIRSTSTDESGRFCFTDLKPGEYTIREEAREGWYATTPTEVTLTMLSGGDERQTIFLNTQYGKICVLKYEDLNANGQWDEGEPGMANVLVELYLAEDEAVVGPVPTPIRSGLTDENGSICFTGLILGDYILVEYPPEGTYPNSQGSSRPVSITESNQTVPVTFGNIETGRICVFKYEDDNGNGIRDEGEDTLISVFVELLLDDEVIGSGYTGTCPCCPGLCFSGLELGTYTVRETVPEGWFNTTPAEVLVVLDESGEHVSVTFLNTEYSSISGNKYQDMDGDGYLDPEDTPIEGWEIELWLDDVYIATDYTDENGFFQFEGLVPGNYYLYEEAREGWYNTTTNEVYVRLHSGDNIRDVLFLNTQYSSVCGYKVEDINGDGVWDVGEEGIPGWEISLYRLTEQIPVGALFDPWQLVATAETDECGHYC
ncbi:MAG TPA: SdrD B-like domain-containing protein, partial [Methanomassiliicoccales archaeon]|nr:SdrD B-like domain-containing protein [Methanomassiliicoccales archaeon]